MENAVMLVKPMYSCQGVPVVVFGKRCPKPCLYCDLSRREFPKDKIIASGRRAVLEKLVGFKSAYFSAVSDCFLPENRSLAHYLIENVWKNNGNFVPLVVTKHAIPQKTIVLFAKNRHRIVVQISIPSLNDRIVSILEPGAPKVSKRLKIIRKLTDAGVPVIAVVMPWFGIYEKSESIEDLPRELAKAGVSRCIIGTGVLPEKQMQKMIGTGDKSIVDAAKKMTAIRKAMTKTGYTLPPEKRIREFSRLVSAFKKFGIKGRICTADNPDLKGSDLPLCTKFRHHNFRKAE